MSPPILPPILYRILFVHATCILFFSKNKAWRLHCICVSLFVAVFMYIYIYREREFFPLPFFFSLFRHTQTHAHSYAGGEERVCCLLVLNLVSSTLPCIRQSLKSCHCVRLLVPPTGREHPAPLHRIAQQPRGCQGAVGERGPSQCSWQCESAPQHIWRKNPKP
jgi:hypothetical protein